MPPDHQCRTTITKDTPVHGLYLLMLRYCRYHPTHIVITENGVSVPQEQNMRVADATKDAFRVDYYR